jgi:hypothetical protein
LEISSLVYTLNCKLDGNVKAYCLDAHYLKKGNEAVCETQNKVGIEGVCQ